MNRKGTKDAKVEGTTMETEGIEKTMIKAEDLGFDRYGSHDKRLTHVESVFVGLLWVDHSGAGNKISADDLASEFAFALAGIPCIDEQYPDEHEYWKRRVRGMQNHIIWYHRDIPMLSKAGTDGGYWIAETEEEAEAFYYTFRKRGMTGLVKASRGRQSAIVDAVEQLAFNFEDMVDKARTIPDTPRIRTRRPSDGMAPEMVDALLEKMTRSPEIFADSLRNLRAKYFSGGVILEKARLASMRQKAADFVCHNPTESVESFKGCLLDEAHAICAEDKAMCEAIGRFGEPLIPDGGMVLTHCNAGALATAGIGTALAPMYMARQNGKTFTVYVDETRPLLQGARLTAWELTDGGIDAVLVCDNMAASLMQQGRINMVITGADRIAANGDAANKIGTLGLSILARHYEVPFYIAAPSSTFDLSLADGTQIPIEERRAEEIRGFGQSTVAPAGINVYNPAFDVTKAEDITAIVTDLGLIAAPNREKITEFFKNRNGHAG